MEDRGGVEAVGTKVKVLKDDDDDDSPKM